jgi:hypothetical protein
MMINKQQKQSSTLLMALSIIAATIIFSSIVVQMLGLFGDAEAKKVEKLQKQNNGCSGFATCSGGHGHPAGGGEGHGHTAP